MRLHEAINCSFCNLPRTPLYHSEIGGDPPAICIACIRDAAEIFGLIEDKDTNSALMVIGTHAGNARYPWRDMKVGDYFLVPAAPLGGLRLTRRRVEHAAGHCKWLKVKFTYTQTHVKVTRVV